MDLSLKLQKRRGFSTKATAAARRTPTGCHVAQRGSLGLWTALWTAHVARSTGPLWTSATQRVQTSGFEDAVMGPSASGGVTRRRAMGLGLSLSECGQYGTSDLSSSHGGHQRNANITAGAMGCTTPAEELTTSRASAAGSCKERGSSGERLLAKIRGTGRGAVLGGRSVTWRGSSTTPQRRWRSPGRQPRGGEGGGRGTGKGREKGGLSLGFIGRGRGGGECGCATKARGGSSVATMATTAAAVTGEVMGAAAASARGRGKGGGRRHAGPVGR